MFKKWLIDSIVRTVKTFAQSLVGVLGVGGLNIGILETNWTSALSVAAMAALICFLGCISTMPLGEKGEQKWDTQKELKQN